MQPFDCRAEVFRARGHEVLGSVTQGTQMAQPDPYDVAEVHQEARSAFRETLAQVRAGPVSKILLVRGQAGCGKTHLIRALRAEAHAARHGAVAYVHMTSEHGDYRRYLLRQVVRSLSDPYVFRPDQPQQASALDIISDELAAAAGEPDPAAAEALRETDDDAALADLVADRADALSEATDAAGRPRFGGVDLNTLRVLLYRQSTRKPIQRRVAGFLNGDPLADADWRRLAALPAGCDRGPMLLLTQLARATLATLGGPLIVCVDQIEASDITGKNHEPFVHAMSTACELIEAVPGCMVLLSCLDTAYDTHAPHLLASYRHRIENDPPPVLLAAARSEREIRLIVSRRLKWLYESEGLEHHPTDSVYPMPEDVPARMDKQDLRTTLQLVHRYWEKVRRAEPGDVVPWPVDLAPPVIGTDPDQAVDRLRIAWNEYLTAGGHDVSEDDAVQLDLFEWAMTAARDELEEGAVVTVARPTAAAGQPEGFALSVTVDLPRTPRLSRLVALCDKDPRGNGLRNQIAAADRLRTAKGQGLVVIRSTRFPRAGKTADAIESMRKAGDAFVVVDDPSWQAMQAMKTFLAARVGGVAPAVVAAWRRTDGPLVRLPALAAIVRPPPRPVDGGAGEKLRKPVVRRPVESPAAPAPAAGGGGKGDKEATSSRRPQAARTGTAGGVPAVAPAPAGPMVVGVTDGFAPADVILGPQTLARHTAIFGANGSGKTVLALTIVEMLLERGVSVVLFDRKGDLATYAVDAAWAADTGAPDEKRRRPALRARADVHLYTPGNPLGRPLVLPLLPAGLAKLSPDDREEEARQAAVILCDVCGPPAGKADMFTTVLAKAVELLCAADAPRTLEDLQGLLLSAPPDLLALLPAHTDKHCGDVGRRLNERRVANGRLFADAGERLDLPAMLAAGGGRPGDHRPGRPRLNIVSTQFLDPDAGLIWVAQFLAAAGRYILTHPSPGGRLQAVLMFDEADLYIPANRKPATKPGLDNLLRRGRGAGVGVLLATQNAGDFDYKALDNVTTVFAGKLTTPRAVDKLRSRLNDAADRLPKKGKGQFVMGQEADVRDIRGHMSLVRPTPVPRDEVERLAAAQRSSTVTRGGRESL